MRECTLQVDLHDYWHCGSGSGRGTLYDAVVDRDDSGMPYVPGRMLKGLLRDALESLASFDADNPVDVDSLFGRRLRDETSRHDFTTGSLSFSDARLSPDTARWLSGSEGAAAAFELSRGIYATAMNDGVAKAQSLRSMEVMVPMPLEATITGPGEGAWPDVLARAARLVRALGAHRSRGLGRCTLSVKEVARG